MRVHLAILVEVRSNEGKRVTLPARRRHSHGQPQCLKRILRCHRPCRRDIAEISVRMDQYLGTTFECASYLALVIGHECFRSNPNIRLGDIAQHSFSNVKINGTAAGELGQNNFFA